MEYLVGIGLILILTEFREWRFQKKINVVLGRMKTLRGELTEASGLVSGIADELVTKATDEAVLTLIAQVEKIDIHMQDLLREKEQVAKFTSKPLMDYDVIEGGL